MLRSLRFVALAAIAAVLILTITVRGQDEEDMNGQLSYTCANAVNQLYTDGKALVPPLQENNGDWSNHDLLEEIHPNTRLVAVRCLNVVSGSCSGILVTFSTNNYTHNSENVTWKCSASAAAGWETLGFDDSSWLPAFNTGRNGEIITGCSRIPIAGISQEAHWIWTSGFIDYDLVVSCRGWTPVCVDVNPCNNGGICSRTTENICQCPVHFQGKYCDDDFNECENSPCHPSSTCELIDQQPGYICTCIPQRTGQLCETDLTTCASNPCQNDGTCNFDAESGGYDCSCQDGYTGLHCETVIDLCENEPCLNGATCTPGINSYECLCDTGYTGSECGNIINYCVSNPCVNGGTCQMRLNGYTCSCYPGYSGLLCETGIDNCATNPCLNGGTCIDNGAAAGCTCPPEWSGSLCNTPTDNCASNPCRNGGTCSSDLFSFNCSCDPVWLGTTCETLAPHCGDMMAQSSDPPVRGYWSNCIITFLENEKVNIPCNQLIKNLNVFGDEPDFVQAGGYYGCYGSTSEAGIANSACIKNYNINGTLAACPVCTHFAVCLHLPD